MDVRKYFGVNGSKKATGITVIIDIFRAATVSAYLFSKGVDKIFPVSTPKEAFAFKIKHPNCLLIGEEHGIKIDGFDYGNSPYEISRLTNLNDKVVVHRSSQGTQGIVNASRASKIIFGSFTTCSAIVNYIQGDKNQIVSVVAMDGEGSEDDLFADYLIANLTHQPALHINEIVARMKKHPDGWKFLDPNNHEFPEEDFYLCLGLDTFNFVPVLKNGYIVKSI